MHMRNDHFILWLGVLAVLIFEMLDYATTLMILWCGGSELNPMMIGIVRDPLLFFLVKISMVTIVFLFVFILTKVRDCGKISDKDWKTINPLMMIGIYVFFVCFDSMLPVINNLTVLGKFLIS